VGCGLVVCTGCGGALGEGVRFCSNCGAAAPKESPEPGGSARGAGGLLGRSLLGSPPTTTAETVTRRLADEGWGGESTAARGLATRRTAPTRRPLAPVVDMIGREDVLTLLLSDEPTALPREPRGLTRLLGVRGGR
jgi:hypothetical protein